MTTTAMTFKRVTAQPAFIIAALLLLLAAVGLNTATQYLQLHFKKLAVPLAKPLEEVPLKMNHWVQVSKDEPLAKDIEDTLGTKMYIFRDYVDTRVVPQAEVDKFKDQSFSDRKRLFGRLQMDPRYSEGVINCAVTYYTGMVDTVAHIPDRCYIADGFQPSEYTVPAWNVNGRDLKVRFINFEDQTGVSRISRSVAYFFHVNGVYESNPIDVRGRLQDLREKYGYYSKIELMTLLKDRDKSAKVMADFLNSALPEIERSFPDWKAVQAYGVQDGVKVASASGAK